MENKKRASGVTKNSEYTTKTSENTASVSVPK